MVSREEAEAWRTHGYFTRDLPAAVVDAARAAAHFSKPSDSGHTDFGSNGAYEFPCGEDGLDLLPLELHDCAAELLGGPVVLSQADCWVKHAAAIVPSGKMSNQSQRMHADWGNNQIMPPVWSEPSAVAALVYLDGPEDGLEGGGTSVAPRSGDDDAAYALERLIEQPGYGGRPFLNDSEEAEAWFRANEPEVAERRAQLYAREQYLAPARGRALVYRLDLWHHGTPVLAGQRRAYNIVYHSQQQHPAALSGGRWEKGFWRMAYDVKNGFYGVPERLFCLLSPHQRTAIGFPPAGDPWLTEERIKLIALRLPDFDPAPYLRAAAAEGPISGGGNVQANHSSGVSSSADGEVAAPPASTASEKPPTTTAASAAAASASAACFCCCCCHDTPPPVTACNLCRAEER